MKSLILIFCLWSFGLHGLGQIAKIKLDTVKIYADHNLAHSSLEKQIGQKIFTAMEIIPGPHGGKSELYRRIVHAVEWKREFIKEKVVGDIEFTFLVDKWKVTEFETQKDEVGHGVADAIKKAVSSAEWGPGIQSGRPLKTRFRLNIRVDGSGFD